MRSLIHAEDRIPNTERRFGELGPGETYQFAVLADDNGDRPLLFTERELEVAHDRALRNPEDAEAAFQRACHRRALRILLGMAGFTLWTLLAFVVGGQVAAP